MTQIRQRMLNDMTVRGLAGNTKTSYLNSVSKLALHYGRSPDRIKDRYVPLSPRLLEQLREYWRRMHPEHWLFPGQYDHRMTRDGAWHIYKTPKEKAGIDKPGGIHTLRHCYATGLPEAGVELHVIQRRLGHSSIRSTMRYLHLPHDKTSATPSPLDLLEFPRPAQA